MPSWPGSPFPPPKPRHLAAPSSESARRHKMGMMKRALVSLFCLPLLATSPLVPLVPVNEAGFQKLVDSHKGKVVLYDFWATWCAPCRAELPQLAVLQDKLRAKGLEVITISADDKEHRAAAEKFIQMFRV